MQEETGHVINLHLTNGKLEFSTNVLDDMILLLGMLERAKHIVNSGQLQQPKTPKIQVPDLKMIRGGKTKA
jgi:hypothetical protein